MSNIVILGLGAAGFGAAFAAKKHDRNAKITIIDNKDFDLMHQCGLPFVIDDEITDFSKLKYPLHFDKMGITLINNSDVIAIEFNNKEIQYLNKKNIAPNSSSMAQTNKKEKIGYDKLIIATGSKPIIPPIKTENKVYTVHNIKDTEDVKKNAKKGEKAVIIGAGAIGLEVAVALKNKGMNVTVKDMLPSCFPKSLDKDMSEIVEQKLKEKGIKLELGKKIDEIKEKALVVMATGVKPKIDFLKETLIKINDFGIEVNEDMETSIKDVYAVGDCCSVKSLINKEKWPSMLANNAYREGVIAGVNAAGGSMRYAGIIGTFVSVIDGLEVAATGFNSFFAEKYKIKTIIGKATGKNRPEWFGPADELIVKIIADEKGKVIGGQAIGTGAKERVNIISTAIKAGFGLKELSDLELAYCPAVSEHYDVLIMAAELALRKIK